MIEKFSRFVVFNILVVASVNVFAWGDEKSLEACSELLPKGHKFKFSISGEVDTTATKTGFKAKMELSDGSGKVNPELEKLAKPYIKCVSKLIR